MNPNRVSHLLMHFALVAPSCCSAWSLFGTRAPPRKTQSLVDHLKRGQSRVSEDVSVVLLSDNECGIELDDDDEDHHDQQLAYIDRSEFITSACGLETDAGHALQTYFALHDDLRTKHAQLLPAMYIAIFLSLTHTNQLSGGNSDAYLKTLPSLHDLQHLPVFWNRNSLEELQNSRVKPAIQQRRNEWEEEYDIVLEAIREGDASNYAFVDLETWCWARSILTSRAFVDDIKNELCLVPYVDMMNHISSAQAKSRREHVVKCNWAINASGFCLVLPSGESEQQREDDNFSHNEASKQVEISYGTHSNSNFLMNYGFSIVDDFHQMVDDKATLSLTLEETSSASSTTTEADTAIESLWEADGMGDCHDIQRNVTVAIGDPGPMKSLLSLCRVACSEGSELSNMRDVFVRVGETTTQTDDGLVPQLGATLCRSPFSVANEIRAMERLQSVAADGLGGYGTTLTEDDDLLHKGLSWKWRWFGKKQNVNRMHNALIVRRGEKQIMQHFYNLATISLRFLQMANTDFDEYKGMLEATLENEEPMIEH